MLVWVLSEAAPVTICVCVCAFVYSFKSIFVSVAAKQKFCVHKFALTVVGFVVLYCCCCCCFNNFLEQI